MKHLVITFSLAIAVIAAAIIFDGNNRIVIEGGDGVQLAKSLIKTDDTGRVTEEVTLHLVDNNWSETQKKVYFYDGVQVKQTTFDCVDGMWIPSEMRVSTMKNQVLAKQSIYTLKNNNWVLSQQLNYDDLSSAEFVEDLLFDKDGNLIMKAIYTEKNGEMQGFEKSEYTYSNGLTNKQTCYAWNGKDWSKKEVLNVQYLK